MTKLSNFSPYVERTIIRAIRDKTRSLLIGFGIDDKHLIVKGRL